MPEPYFHGKMDFAKMIKQKSEPCSSLFSQVPPRNGCDCRSRDRGAEKFDDVLEMEKLGQEVKAASEAGMCPKKRIVPCSLQEEGSLPNSGFSVL